MSVLLIGNWDGPVLTITDSHTVADGDQTAVDELLDGRNVWAHEYLVDSHEEAIQRAYDQEVGPDPRGDLVDDVAGYEPTR
ncbi:hypothetical protein [Streptomyces anulatus]|uniref:hypothetical protein n=1 Tax=Streptomyces anulatus TaxID=1892 RepID=UPI0037DC4B91|nr:hypothetical protein OHB50_39535 [Streptomyces anulatus]